MRNDSSISLPSVSFLIGIVLVFVVIIASIASSIALDDGLKNYEKALVSGNVSQAIPYVCPEFQNLAQRTVNSDNFFAVDFARQPVTVNMDIKIVSSDTDTNLKVVTITESFNAELPDIAYSKSVTRNVRVKSIGFTSWCIIPPGK